MSPFIFIFAFFASIVLTLGTTIRTPEFEKARFIPFAASVLCIGLIAALGFQWFDFETPFIQMAVIAIIANMVTVALRVIYVAETNSSVPADSYEQALVEKPQPVSLVAPERKKPVVAIDKDLLTEGSLNPGGTRYKQEKFLVETEA
ncbi:MAG: hypothetical protein WCG20_00985 [bacterium]